MSIRWSLCQWLFLLWRHFSSFCLYWALWQKPFSESATISFPICIADELLLAFWHLLILFYSPLLRIIETAWRCAFPIRLALCSWSNGSYLYRIFSDPGCTCWLFPSKVCHNTFCSLRVLSFSFPLRWLPFERRAQISSRLDNVRINDEEAVYWLFPWCASSFWKSCRRLWHGILFLWPQKCYILCSNMYRPKTMCFRALLPGSPPMSQNLPQNRQFSQVRSSLVVLRSSPWVCSNLNFNICLV